MRSVIVKSASFSLAALFTLSGLYSKPALSLPISEWIPWAYHHTNISLLHSDMVEERHYYAIKDYHHVLALCGQKSKNSDLACEAILGDMYRKGEGGLKSNIKEAIKRYEIAADNGDSYSQQQLGDLYYQGLLVKTDYEKAAENYQQALYTDLKSSSVNSCRLDAVMLESDSPESIGETWSTNDTHFTDINLSLKSPLGYGWFTNNNRDCSDTFLPYFGVNLRLGFYLGSEDSSPVIAKAFNPYLRFRTFIRKSNISSKDNTDVEYWDWFEYGHLSNGQNIETGQELGRLINTLGNTRLADNYISRGWDYVGTKVHFYHDRPTELIDGVGNTLSVRRYIGGFLQQSVEEFNPQIESPRKIEELNQVSGIQWNGSISISDKEYISHILNSLTVSVETGFKDIGRWDTFRIDTSILPDLLGTERGFSIDFWVQNGYNSDLVFYYKRVITGGLAFTFTTFRSHETQAMLPLQTQSVAP